MQRSADSTRGRARHGGSEWTDLAVLDDDVLGDLLSAAWRGGDPIDEQRIWGRIEQAMEESPGPVRRPWPPRPENWPQPAWASSSLFPMPGAQRRWAGAIGSGAIAAALAVILLSSGGSPAAPSSDGSRVAAAIETVAPAFADSTVQRPDLAAPPVTFQPSAEPGERASLGNEPVEAPVEADEPASFVDRLREAGQRLGLITGTSLGSAMHSDALGARRMLDLNATAIQAGGEDATLTPSSAPTGASALAVSAVPAPAPATDEAAASRRDAGTSADSGQETRAADGSNAPQRETSGPSAPAAPRETGGDGAASEDRGTAPPSDADPARDGAPQNSTPEDEAAQDGSTQDGAAGSSGGSQAGGGAQNPTSGASQGSSASSGGTQGSGSAGAQGDSSNGSEGSDGSGGNTQTDGGAGDAQATPPQGSGGNDPGPSAGIVEVPTPTRGDDEEDEDEEEDGVVVRVEIGTDASDETGAP